MTPVKKKGKGRRAIPGVGENTLAHPFRGVGRKRGGGGRKGGLKTSGT